MMKVYGMAGNQTLAPAVMASYLTTELTIVFSQEHST